MPASPLHVTLVDDSDLAQAGLVTLLAPFADRVEVDRQPQCDRAT